MSLCNDREDWAGWDSHSRQPEGGVGCLEQKCASFDNGVTHLVLIKDSATSQSLAGFFIP